MKGWLWTMGLSRGGFLLEVDNIESWFAANTIIYNIISLPYNHTWAIIYLPPHSIHCTIPSHTCLHVLRMFHMFTASYFPPTVKLVKFTAFFSPQLAGLAWTTHYTYTGMLTSCCLSLCLLPRKFVISLLHLDLPHFNHCTWSFDSLNHFSLLSFHLLLSVLILCCLSPYLHVNSGLM